MIVTLPPPYKGHCLFCGSSVDLTDEHVFSKGIRNRMPTTTTVRTVVGEEVLNASNTLNVVLKDAVCAACNGGWMSGLERTFIRVFGDQLSTPSQRHLDPVWQERVATWAIKVALLLQLFTSVRRNETIGYHVPDDNLSWLWRHQNAPSPPPGSRVWLATLSDPGAMLAHFQGSSLGWVAGEPVAYFVTFSLGYLVFQVHGHGIFDPEGRKVRAQFPVLSPPPPLRRTITEIWPGNGREVVWPTAQPVIAAAMPLLERWPDEVLGIPATPV